MICSWREGSAPLSLGRVQKASEYNAEQESDSLAILGIRYPLACQIPNKDSNVQHCMLLRNGCTHLPLTRLHDVVRHSKILRRGHAKSCSLMSVSCGYCLLLATVQRGAEGQRATYTASSNLSVRYKTCHVAYDAVRPGNVYRPDCMTS